MNFAKVIKSLLITNDKLYLSGIGTFISHYKPAELVQGMNYMKPPSKDVTFDFDLHEDDRLLANFIAQQEGVSTEEADNRIKIVTDNIHERIHNDRKFGILDIGSFSLSNNKIIFEPDVRINLHGDAYGLPDVPAGTTVTQVESPKVETSSPPNPVKPKSIPEKPALTPPVKTKPIAEKIKKVPNEKKSSSGKWILIGILIPVVAAAVFLFLILPNAGFFDDKEPNALAKLKESVQEEPTLDNEVARFIDTTLSQDKALKYVENNQQADQVATSQSVEVDSYAHCNDFYIIFGSFKSRSLALKHRNKLRSQGFQAEILQSNDNHRVYIKHFKNRNQALIELQNLQQANMNVWLLSI